MCCVCGQEGATQHRTREPKAQVGTQQGLDRSTRPHPTPGDHLGPQHTDSPLHPAALAPQIHPLLVKATLSWARERSQGLVQVAHQELREDSPAL